MDDIYSRSHEGEGMARAYENGSWMVGLKNYKAANDAALFTELERHLETDELFLLLAGSCVLVSATEEGGRLAVSAEAMAAGSLYVVPTGLWHTTITRPGSKLALIEDPRTGSANSEARTLGAEELAAARAAIAAALAARP